MPKFSLETLTSVQASISAFFKTHKVGLLMGLLTGVLTGTSYIPFPPWALLFNYVPLWWYWLQPQTKPRHMFWSAWLSQFILNGIGFFWIYHTAHEFGHLPAPIAGLALFFFACFAHLHFPLIGLIFGWLKKRLSSSSLSAPPHGACILIIACLWALAEIYWPYLFQWHMGYTLLWAKLPAFHWADIIGFQGLSFILLLLNGVFLKGFLSTEKPLSFTNVEIRFPIYSLLLLILLNVSGHYHGREWSDAIEEKTIENTATTTPNTINTATTIATNGGTSQGTLNFLPVQANIGYAEKIMAERGLGYQDFIADRFMALTDEALRLYPQTDFIVWPESAIPLALDSSFTDHPRHQKLTRWVKSHGKGLITGGYSQVPKEMDGAKVSPLNNTSSNSSNRRFNTYNALFYFDGEGKAMTKTPYRKRHLLAFGEYTPFADWFPVLNEISPAGEGFDRGPGPMAQTLQTNTHGQLVVAPQICYEALYPDFTRIGTLEGAEVLINVTNDSWFGPLSEPYQHQEMTFARAIENRRPLLRVTNTGFTSAIEASGKKLIRSPLYKEWSRPIALKYRKNPPLTLYTRYGNFWPAVVCLFLLMGIGFAMRSKAHSKN